MPATRATVGSINVLLAVQFGQATAGLSNFAGTVEKTGVRTQRAVSGIDRTVSGLNRSIGSINGRGFSVLAIGALRAKQSLDQMRGLLLATSALFGGLVPAALGASLVRVADRAHLLSNNLKTVTKDADDLKATQEALFAVSQRTRSGFEATTTIYARTARATEGLNVSQAKLLRLTETIQKSFAVGGATTAEAQGAAIQLSQGIASNRFSGDEFRSVAENAPVLLRGMAQSLGVSIGKLREMAHAGELTADTVVKAIIDASQRIDEEFAKTTSTIGQAFVQVDNALLKYVGDSDKATVASNAIVTVLQALASNIDTVADALLLLGGAFGARLAGGAASRSTAWAGGLRATRTEALNTARSIEALSLAEMKAARSDMVSKRLAFNRALSDGVLTAKQMERQQRAVAASVTTYNAAVQKAAASTIQLKDAQAAASFRGVAKAAGTQVGSALSSLVGGPVGAAILGVGAYMYMMSRQAAIAEEQTNRYAEAIQKAGEDSDGASGGIRKASEELSRTAKAASDASRIQSYAQAVSDVGTNLGQMGSALLAAQGVLNFFSSSYSELTKLYQAFREGKISAEQFKDASDAIARGDIGLAPYIAQMQDFADKTDAARGRVDALNDSLLALQKSAFAAMEAAAGLKNLGVGEKGDKPEHILTNDEFNSRFGQPYSKDWKELFPDYYKKQKAGRAPAKTADDRFDNSVQSLRDRGDELDRERESLNLNYAEQLRRQESLKLEQEALKQVREEARRNNQENWQSVQLSQEQVDRIKEEVDAYVEKAMALKKAREEQEAWNTAAGEFGGIMKGLLDGTMDWKDALLQLIPVVLKLMNSLNVAQGGEGLFGGGIFQSLVGGLLGFSFHGGGTVGAGGNVVQFPSGAPYVGKFHGGGNFGGQRAKHDEVMALVQKNENVFTDGQTDKIIGALSSNLSGVKESGGIVDVRVAMDRNGNLQAYVERTSGRVSAQVVQAAAPGIMQGGATATQQAARNRPGFFR